MPRVAIAVSGTGSLLEAMIEQKLPVAAVYADRPCRGLDEVAVTASIPNKLIARNSFKADFDRIEYTERFCHELIQNEIDILAMAGFMTVFDELIFQCFPGLILNTHPSLLPAFKGEKAVIDALAFGVKITGCTIHVATAELDAGPILAQAAVCVHADDTEKSLHERIKTVERKLYPKVIREQLELLSI